MQSLSFQSELIIPVVILILFVFVDIQSVLSILVILTTPVM